MSRKTSSEVDESIEQSDRKNERFETVEDKAIEALKHDDLMKDCDVTVRAHNRDHDSDRNVTDHLLRTGDGWIGFRTWAEAGGGSGLAVIDHGETLQVEALELDHKVIADRICSDALDAIDALEEVEGRTVKPFTTLIRNVEEVTEDLVARWQSGAEHVVKERLYEGIAGWTGHIAWSAHEEEGIHIEADRAATRFIDEYVTYEVSNNVDETIYEICLEALYDAITDHRGRRTPHLEYVAEVNLID